MRSFRSLFLPLLLLAAVFPAQAAPWEFQQRLYDVDTTFANWASYLNAVPVGLTFTHGGRGYLATLHTVFQTTDGGQTWRNIDHYPPPQPHSSDFFVLRSPRYISDIAAWPGPREGVNSDSLYLATFNAEADTGTLWLLQYSVGQHWLYPQPQLGASSWLTTVVIPDSCTAVAFSGLDGELYRNDSLDRGLFWQQLSPVKAFPRNERTDSITPGQTWVKGVTSVGPLVVAVGSHHWISRDNGHLWHITPADPQSEEAVSFCDSLHGMTGGGVTTPVRGGWVHMTNDGGRSWGGRALESDLPVRAVLRLSPELAFAGGGQYARSVGRIWATTDGGASWLVETELTAEITELAARRVNNAYVDVVAAGAFVDYRGGVWRARVFLPDTAAGAVIYAEPDTLMFGVVVPGAQDTQTVLLRNGGTRADTVLSITATTSFEPLWSGPLELAPGQSVEVPIVLTANAGGIARDTLRIVTAHSGQMDLLCRVDVNAAVEPGAAALPQTLALDAWPNPSNAAFSIRYDLARAGTARLRVYDLTGRLAAELLDAHVEAGSHTLSWHTDGLASGLYFLRLDASGATRTRKLLLLK